MKNPRGFIGGGALLAIILGLVVVVGGAYYVTQPSPGPESSTESLMSDTDAKTTPPAQSAAPATGNPLTISALSPSSGPAGTTVMLTGTGFGSVSIVTAAESKTPMRITSLSPTRLSFVIPGDLSPGTYHIQVIGSDQQTHGTLPTSNTVSFTVIEEGSIAGSFVPTTIAGVLANQDKQISVTGKVVGTYAYAGGTGYDVLLTDNNGTYVLATVAHAFVGDFGPAILQMKKGDTVTIQGMATVTDSRTVEDLFGLSVVLPSTIGLISIEGIPTGS